MSETGSVSLQGVDRWLALAQQSLLSHFGEWCEGSVIVDTNGCIVWMNDRYPLHLGISDPAKALGQPIEKVIPNSLMRHVVESGQAILLDIMDAGKESFVVTRLPLHDDNGKVVGAIGFLIYDSPKPLLPVVSRYRALVDELQETQRRLANVNLRGSRYNFSHFVGAHPCINTLKQRARRAARSDAAVLICGETGTGKELIAHAIHATSPRSDKPFVAINIAAVPENLLEAEFFGVAPGAYTGAERRGRDGKFKLADGGTLFLDEIGDMPFAVQAKLLRVLQEGVLEPLGSNRLTPVSVRVIAATSRNLRQMVEQGNFRADLFYRLNVLSLDTVPLRAHMIDLPLLVESLLENICQRLRQQVPCITPAAYRRLGQHDWPGNVRELANVLERAVLLNDNEILNYDSIDAVMPPVPSEKTTFAAPSSASVGVGAVNGLVAHPPSENLSDTLALADAVACAERIRIVQALTDNQGNKSRTARQLGISRATLYEKIRSLKIAQ